MSTDGPISNGKGGSQPPQEVGWTMVGCESKAIYEFRHAAYVIGNKNKLNDRKAALR
jgi:hypothetical protein